MGRPEILPFIRHGGVAFPCPIYRGPAMMLPEQAFIFDHISFDKHDMTLLAPWKCRSSLLSMSLVSPTVKMDTQEKEQKLFISSNYTPRWSIFITFCHVAFLFRRIFLFAKKLGRNWGTFVVMSKMCLRSRFFPHLSRFPLLDSNSKLPIH